MKRFNSKNPCPVCAKGSGCAEPRPGTVWCLREDREFVGEYRRTHELRDGMGWAYRLDSHSVSSSPRRLLKRTLAKEPTPTPTFTDAELELVYRQLSNLPLSAPDADRLKARGLPVDKESEFCTLTPKSRVSLSLSPALEEKLKLAGGVPGIRFQRSPADFWQVASSAGVFLPMLSVEGRVISGQVLARNPQRGKYKFLAPVGGVGATKIRKGKEGVPQTVEIPDFQIGDSSVSGSRQCQVQTLGDKVRVSLTSSLGGILMTATQRVPPERLLGVEGGYHALLLAVQSLLYFGAPKSGISIRGFTQEFSRFFFSEPQEPHLAFLHRLCLQGLARLPSKAEIIPEDLSATSFGGDTHQFEDLGFLDLSDVWLVDGVLKSKIVAQQWRKITIGCPGGNHASSPDLAESLEAIKPSWVSLMPDAGDTENRSQVPKRNAATLNRVSALGASPRIGWWGQFRKPSKGGKVGDIDEIPLDTKIEWLAPDSFLRLHPSQIQSALKGGFTRAGLAKVSLEKKPPFPRPHLKPPTPKEFLEGERLQTVEGLIAQGHKFIADLSPAGSGKSKDFSQWMPEALGVHTLLWIVGNPVILEGEDGSDWAQYRGRDRGRTLRAHDRRVVAAAEKEDSLLYEANCQKNDATSTALDFAVPPSVQGFPCLGCEHQQTCSSSEGWYQYDRARTLASRRIRLPASALGPESIKDRQGKIAEKSKSSDPGTGIILDDVNPWVETIQFRIEDVRKSLWAHEHQLSLFAPKFGKFLEDLLSFLERPQPSQRDVPRHHLDFVEAGIFPAYFEIADEKPGVNEVLESERASILEALETNNKYGFRKFWLRVAFDFIFDPERRGYFLADFDADGNPTVSISKVNHRFLAALKHPAVSFVVVADATGNASHLAQWLGVPQIPAITQTRPEKEAEILLFQGVGLGELGYSRSERQVAEVGNLKKALRKEYGAAAATIDLKKFNSSSDQESLADQIELAWRSTSRGSNAAKDKFVLSLFGAPRKNLIASQIEFSLLSGDFSIPRFSSTYTAYPLGEPSTPLLRVSRESAHPGFAEFYFRQTLAEINQGLARLRGIRRDSDLLVINFLSEFPLDLDLLPPNTKLTVVPHSKILEAPGMGVDPNSEYFLGSGGRIISAPIEAAGQMMAQESDALPPPPLGGDIRYVSVDANKTFNREDLFTHALDLAIKADGRPPTQKELAASIRVPESRISQFFCRTPFVDWSGFKAEITKAARSEIARRDAEILDRKLVSSPPPKLSAQDLLDEAADYLEVANLESLQIEDLIALTGLSQVEIYRILFPEWQDFHAFVRACQLKKVDTLDKRC